MGDRVIQDFILLCGDEESSFAAFFYPETRAKENWFVWLGFIVWEVVVEIVQRCVALFPRRSNITFYNKLSDPELRLWYAQKNSRI